MTREPFPPLPGLGSSGDLAADRRFAWAEAALRDGAAAEAADLLAQALERVPGWAPAWLSLGDARLAEGRPVEAADAFRRCLALDPADRLGAALRLARMGERPAAGAMTDAFVAGLFDAYAPRFEEHLTVALRYRGPALLSEAIDRVRPGLAGARILDLGCGTGLMGEALRPRAAWLAGCDLSSAMVAQAAAKGVYDRLDTGSMESVLAGEPAGMLDVVTAADVLVYVGDLHPLFAAVARVLRSGGVFAFTAQSPDGAAPPDGVLVGEDLRFRHGDAHVRSAVAAAGMTLPLLDSAWARQDRGVLLPGLVGVARRG